MKIRLVYGAPCSGKSTYCKENMTSNDIVYDYDSLQTALTYNQNHTLDSESTRDFIIDFRFSILRRIKNYEDIQGTCFFTSRHDVSEELSEYGEVEVLKLEATEEECVERLMNDDSRPEKEEWKKKIKQWFEENEGESRSMKNTIESKLQNRQYRSMILEVRNSEEEKDDCIVRGYATTFDMPYTLYGDDEWRLDEIISKNAFDKCDMSDVIMQYDHNGKVFARTRNETLKLTVDEHGLFVEAYLGGTEEGRNLYEEIKGGYIDRMSFGFIVAQDEVLTKEIDEVEVCTRTITEISKLFDVSAVSFPANDFTEISARNFFNGVKEKIEAERLAEQRRRLKLKAKMNLL